MNDKSDRVRNWKNPSFLETPGGKTVSRSLSLGLSLRKQVREGWALGTFLIDLPHPSTVTALAVAGFDFVVLDMEHSSLDFTGLEHLVGACRAAGLPALVRPWGQDTGLIGKILDIGAHGVMAPHVDTVEHAQRVVDEARFAPAGQRGFSPVTKFDGYQRPLQALQESTYVVVQIEGRAALKRTREIASVPGIDAVFIGPYDLALSLGVEPGSEPVFAAAREIVAAVPSGIALGIYIDDPAACADWARFGFGLQCVSFDGRMLADGARAVLQGAGPKTNE